MSFLATCIVLLQAYYSVKTCYSVTVLNHSDHCVVMKGQNRSARPHTASLASLGLKQDKPLCRAVALRTGVNSQHHSSISHSTAFYRRVQKRFYLYRVESAVSVERKTDDVSGVLIPASID